MMANSITISGSKQMQKPIRYAAILTRVHKWVGLAVGLQLVMWTVGGLMMSFFPIEDVRSESLRAEPILLPEDLSIGIDPIIAAKEAGFGQLSSLHLESFAGDPVWRVKANEKQILISAITGKSLLPLGKANAEKLVLAGYGGSGELLELKFVEEGPVEVRRDKSLWRAEFSEPKNFTIWVSAEEGRIIAYRSSLWRVFDFFWMLHIMDYDERDNFNNWLLILFAFSSTLFVFSGVGLLVHRILLRPRLRRGKR